MVIKISIVLASLLGLLVFNFAMASLSVTTNVTSDQLRSPIVSANDSAVRHIYPVSRSRHSYSGSTFRGSKRAFPKRISPPGVRLFIFSPRHKAWAAYLPSGRMVGYGRASGGASWCRDIGRSCRTPRGSFRVFSKGSAGCRSSRYPKLRGGAPMPYCMFFSKYYAIHGSPDVPNRNASHGCIRVKPHAARWLRNNFITIGTRVVVTSY